MSASLVGSEMCIRDSPCTQRMSSGSRLPQKASSLFSRLQAVSSGLELVKAVSRMLEPITNNFCSRRTPLIGPPRRVGGAHRGAHKDSALQ
eukprot:14933451-Alexandrium_andersonii.AAC.1